MPGRLYIPNEVKASIASHFRTAVDQAVDGYSSNSEEEDSLSGYLSGKLEIPPQTVNVERDEREMSGPWKWILKCKKFRGRGKNATERILGADGIFEIHLNVGNRKETKSLLYQSKKDWSNDSTLVNQCIKMSTWREAAIVLNYTEQQYETYSIDSILESKGKKTDAIKKLELAEFLSAEFLECHVGDTSLRYDATRRRLYWRTMNGQSVAAKFSIGNRHALEIHAPKRSKELDPDIDHFVNENELHKHRMGVTNEEILLGRSDSLPGDIKSLRDSLARLYHPDKYNNLDDLLKLTLNARMQEINTAYKEQNKRKKSRSK